MRSNRLLQHLVRCKAQAALQQQLLLLLTPQQLCR